MRLVTGIPKGNIWHKNSIHTISHDKSASELLAFHPLFEDWQNLLPRNGGAN